MRDLYPGSVMRAQLLSDWPNIDADATTSRPATGSIPKQLRSEAFKDSLECVRGLFAVHY